MYNICVPYTTHAPKKNALPHVTIFVIFLCDGTVARAHTMYRIPLERLITQRERQIDMGKATAGYGNYTARVPPDARNGDDPMTPRANMPVTRRKFRRLVNQWRRALHQWD